MNTLLTRFQKEYRSLAVALDQRAPVFSTYRPKYFGEQSAVPEGLKVTSGLTTFEVKASYKRLVANTKNFDKLIDDYREFVKRNCPDALELV